jgi:UDP-N-acetylmuramoyl-L-alanyl-D-glutamate--2,6-diaminopimelate ligase
MRLEDLLADLHPVSVSGDPGIEITGLAFDSRQVEPGTLFVAYAGANLDGHSYIPQAVERGAVAVVGEHPRPEWLGDEVCYARVPDGREALARLAAVWFGYPGREMAVIGVTGTDGKTTTVNLIQSILVAAGRRTGMVSTVNALIGDRYQSTGLHVTTPDALQLQSLLAQMVQAGTEVAILEVTSHGLVHQRVTGAEFDVAVVTNVTHEHLDVHGTWEQYCADKGRLFEMLSTSWRKPNVPKVSVLNADDASYARLQPIAADVQLSYALEGEADVVAREVRVDARGTTLTVRAALGGAESPIAFELHTPLVERFNVYNILAAVSVALALDVPLSAIQAGVAALEGVTGRMERIDEGQGFAAIVDFAHTPAALESALQALRAQTEGRLIVVFGCAGLRDVFKREWMGRIAGELADVTVITAEDPRTEDLASIMDQIAQGCEAAGAREGERYHRVADRGEAIALACRLAEAGDTVIAAGKGHERSMCFGTVEYPWSDQQAMRAALLERLGRADEIEAPVLPTSAAFGERAAHVE